MQKQELSRSALARLRAGDVAALDELFGLYGERVFRVCLGILGKHADAEDATQEVFLRAFMQVGKFSGKAPFSSWLLRLTANHALNLGKAASRRNRRSATLSHELMSDSPSPEQVASGRERATIIADLLQQLPVEQRQVLVLREMEGLDYAELAKVLGLRIGTVASRLVRGRQKLGALLKEKGLEDQMIG